MKRKFTTETNEHGVTHRLGYEEQVGMLLQMIEANELPKEVDFRKVKQVKAWWLKTFNTSLTRACHKYARYLPQGFTMEYILEHHTSDDSRPRYKAVLSFGVLNPHQTPGRARRMVLDYFKKKINDVELKIWLYYGQTLTTHPGEVERAKQYFTKLRKTKSQEEKGLF